MVLDGNIKNVIFDFGGVLLDWNPRHLFRNWFLEKLGDPVEAEREMEYFLTEVCNSEWNEQMDGGKPFAVAIAEAREAHPEFADAIEIYSSRWGEMLGGEISGNVEWLRQLKAEGYGIYGLTNWSGETFFKYAYDGYDFFKLFDGIVVSGVEKMLKPDPAFYRLLLDRYGLKAEECIFIDDREVNQEGARSVGIQAAFPPVMI